MVDRPPLEDFHSLAKSVIHLVITLLCSFTLNRFLSEFLDGKRKERKTWKPLTSFVNSSWLAQKVEITTISSWLPTNWLDPIVESFYEVTTLGMECCKIFTGSPLMSAQDNNVQILDRIRRHRDWSKEEKEGEKNSEKNLSAMTPTHLPPTLCPWVHESTP